MKVDELNVIELEVDMIYIKYGLMDDDGQKPKSLYELYISRKLSLSDLKNKLSYNFGIPDSY